MRLKQLREAHGLTQSEVAGRLGLSPSAVGMYEQGRREPSHSLLRQMAALFGVTTDYLLGIDLPQRSFRDSLLAYVGPERELIDCFQQLPKDRQDIVLNLAKSLLPQKGERSTTSMTTGRREAI